MSLAYIFLPNRLKAFNKGEKMDWIRVKDIPKVYPIGLSHAKSLVREFRTQTNDGWIADGRVVIVKKEDFERWWKNRNKSRHPA